ncbi:F [avian paramyxovirus 10]|uniref:Fusion glycoprotein F0 n=2 Tax=Metaavulavirus falklandense TaxID=2560309 RepID=D9IL76_9MONO|nr:F [Avian paramyxovirus penguin/Falkland Islands/324/2007] [avian paramyxovirus 10]AQQ11604.2 F [Metaavulavirus falklandense] [Metaavulavirus falklandense]ADK12967.2 F [Avian paramyxovirus penguin/Falkland Islands/324/2007] [avian paramyxovirus 10]BAW94653.1 fusion protein [Metaavulavirus falklandense]BAW94660.1 fusion protein [Metaavulavirus falklandense]BBJ77941.1 fusion protein [Metaavulavirus falklandense]
MTRTRLLFLLTCYIPGAVSLDNSILAPAGIISASERQIAIYTQTLQGTIALRFIPVLPQNLSSCAKDTLESYNSTVSNLLLPIAENLNALLKDADKPSQRIIGAIIGSVALGVATTAQVTAALAMTQAQQNARNIWKLKESIKNTNQAVLELKDGLQQSAIALDKVQSFINSEILPQINQLGCEVAANKLGIFLSLYLTEITTVFKNQITNPALSTLSYQALYNLCGGNMAALTKQIGIKDTEINSLYEAELITGQVIGYDSADQILLIQVSYPSVSRVQGVRAVELLTVSVATPKGEGKAIAPSFIAQSNIIAEELDTQPCKFSKTTLYCRQVNTRTLPVRVANCLKGKYNDCQYTTEIGALASRYVTITNGVVANCRSIICRCLDPEGIVAQNSDAAITVIDRSTCKLIQLGDITLRLEGKLSSSYSKNITIDISQVTTSGSLDISSELGSINNTITKVEDLISKSNDWLSKVNPTLISNDTIIALCVIAGIVVIWLVIITILSYYILIKLKNVALLSTMPKKDLNPYVNNTKF